jgi:putative transposase
MRLELTEYLIEKRGAHGRVEEAQRMRAYVSRGTGRRYPLTLICQVFQVSRSSVYAAPQPLASSRLLDKRGPKTRWSDAEVLAGIRAILAASPFHGEGYRKIRARLAHHGLAVSGKRVLRLMRQHGLLAPRRLGPPNGDPAHAGTIIADRPDVMCGTDTTRFYTEREGWCWFFGAIDHGIDELLGWHVATLADRWAALEPNRQGVRHAFGAYRKGRGPGACGPLRLGAAVHRRRLD